MSKDEFIIFGVPLLVILILALVCPFFCGFLWVFVLAAVVFVLGYGVWAFFYYVPGHLGEREKRVE